MGCGLDSGRSIREVVGAIKDNGCANDVSGFCDLETDVRRNCLDRSTQLLKCLRSTGFTEWK